MAESDNAPKIISRKEAIENGLNRYFTGRPCPHGHVCERYVSSWGCAKCVNILGKEWWSRHPDKLREKKKRHARRSKSVAALWRKRNRDRLAINRRERYAKDCIKLNESQRKLYAENPEKRKIHNRAYKARKIGNGGSHTTEDILALFKAQRSKCAYCRISLKRGYHVDHIVALSRGGTNDRRNLQLLCQPCNSRKYARDQIDVMRAMGRLL